jgi:hypothetical protein
MPRQGELILPPVWQSGSWYDAPWGTPTVAQWMPLLGRTYHEAPIEPGRFTMENTIEEMSSHSKLMTLLKKAVIWYVGKDFHGEKTMDDSAYRMLVTSATDASMNNIQINGRIKGHLFHGLVEWANGNILKGIRWMLKR